MLRAARTSSQINFNPPRFELRLVEGGGKRGETNETCETCETGEEYDFCKLFFNYGILTGLTGLTGLPDSTRLPL
jgi:hypothetical protein